jgi:hypothetical protein
MSCVSSFGAKWDSSQSFLFFFLLLTTVLNLFFVFDYFFLGPNLTHNYLTHFPTLISNVLTLVPYQFPFYLLICLITQLPTYIPTYLPMHPISYLPLCLPTYIFYIAKYLTSYLFIFSNPPLILLINLLRFRLVHG